MTKPNRGATQRLLLLVASLALFASACAGGGGAESSAAITAAETNQAQLSLTGDLAATDLLDTSDGSITSLSDVVTGDRPVLLWYWAPH